MKLELNFKSLTILFLLTCVTLIGISTALNAKPSNSDSPALEQILVAIAENSGTLKLGILDYRL